MYRAGSHIEKFKVIALVSVLQNGGLGLEKVKKWR